ILFPTGNRLLHEATLAGTQIARAGGDDDGVRPLRKDRVDGRLHPTSDRDAELCQLGFVPLWGGQEDLAAGQTAPQAELAARLLAPLEEHHPVPLEGGDASGLQAGRPTPRYNDGARI